MRKVVVDASVVLKWIPGKREENKDEARELYRLMMQNKIVVYAPTFLLIEVLNILIMKRKAARQLVRKDIGKLQCIQ